MESNKKSIQAESALPETPSTSVSHQWAPMLRKRGCPIDDSAPESYIEFGPVTKHRKTECRESRQKDTTKPKTKDNQQPSEIKSVQGSSAEQGLEDEVDNLPAVDDALNAKLAGRNYRTDSAPSYATSEDERKDKNSGEPPVPETEPTQSKITTTAPANLSVGEPLPTYGGHNLPVYTSENPCPKMRLEKSASGVFCLKPKRLAGYKNSKGKTIIRIFTPPPHSGSTSGSEPAGSVDLDCTSRASSESFELNLTGQMV